MSDNDQVSTSQGTSASGNHHDDDQEHILPAGSSLAIMLILFVGVGIIALLSIVMGGSDGPGHEGGGRTAYSPEDFPEIVWVDPDIEELRDEVDDHTFRVPPPELEYFPCSDCHVDLEVNLEPRELEEMHDDIELDHGPKERWCFDCHNPDDRDRLRLVNGTLIGFDESYRLCGQCHGTIFRDWRQGIHGRRTGYWNGPKKYLLCASCHNPHTPRFKAIEPLPPPVRPEFLAYQDVEGAKHDEREGSERTEE